MNDPHNNNNNRCSSASATVASVAGVASQQQCTKLKGVSVQHIKRKKKQETSCNTTNKSIKKAIPTTNNESFSRLRVVFPHFLRIVFVVFVYIYNIWI